MISNVERILGKSLKEVELLRLLGDVSIPSPEIMEGESYVELPDVGLSFILSDNILIDAIHIYSKGRSGYSDFIGDMPLHIYFSMSRKDVVSKFGPPVYSGEGGYFPVLGFKGGWDLYEESNFTIHIEYDESESNITLVTLVKR